MDLAQQTEVIQLEAGNLAADQNYGASEEIALKIAETQFLSLLELLPSLDFFGQQLGM